MPRIYRRVHVDTNHFESKSLNRFGKCREGARVQVFLRATILDSNPALRPQAAMEKVRQTCKTSLELGPLGRRRRARHGQLHHARGRPARRRLRAARRRLQPGLALRRRRAADRSGRPRQSAAPHERRRRSADAAIRTASATPTTSSSCRCSARRSGTAWRTCTTAASSTTASRPRALDVGRRGAQRHRQDRRRHRVARRAARPGARRGVERLAAGHAITPTDLEAAERTQGVRVERGDVLLVRTGHLRVFTVDGDRVGYMRQMPGLGIDAVPSGCTRARSRPSPPTPTWSR